MNILVMGGTRLIGEATVRELLRCGHTVTVANRGTRRDVPWASRARWVIADRDDAQSLDSLAKLGADLVVDFSGYLPEQTATLLEALNPATPVLYCSSGSVYQPVAQLPWQESTPYGPWSLWGAYARAKLNSELLLRQAADEGRTVLVVRLPYALGPRNYAPREEFVLNRLLDKATIFVPGDGKALQQFVTAEQVAWSVARLAEKEQKPGFRAYNIADPIALTSLEGFIALAAEVSDNEPRIVYVPGGPTGTDGPFDAADCIFPFPNENYVLDLRAADRAGVLAQPRLLTDTLQSALLALTSEPERRIWRRTAAEERQSART